MTTAAQTENIPEFTELPNENSAAPECDYIAIPVDGGMLNVAVTGQGSPLLLLHGWTLDHRVWTPQLAEIGQRHRLILPDRRGFGQSSAPPDLTKECGDIDRIADALALDKFSILGMSQAGAIAIGYCIARPERVHAAITLGTPLVGAVPSGEELGGEELGGEDLGGDRWSEMIRDGQIAAMRKEWLAHPLLQTSSLENRQIVEQMVGAYEGRDFKSPSILPALPVEYLRDIEVPLLALAGMKDSDWRQRVARFLGNNVPAGAYSSIADAGHLANLCQPAKFNERVIQFLHHFENY